MNHPIEDAFMASLASVAAEANQTCDCPPGQCLGLGIAAGSLDADVSNEVGFNGPLPSPEEVMAAIAEIFGGLGSQGGEAPQVKFLGAFDANTGERVDIPGPFGGPSPFDVVTDLAADLAADLGSFLAGGLAPDADDANDDDDAFDEKKVVVSQLVRAGENLSAGFAVMARLVEETYAE